MLGEDDTARTLPADRAFVVHFAGPGRRPRFAGRVEHLASGEATQFGSLRALLAFFARLLAARGSAT
jgi:hypothetical protein